MRILDSNFWHSPFSVVSPIIRIGKRGACDLLIFAGIIHLFIIYIFSSGKRLPLALLLNVAVCSAAAQSEVVFTSR